MLKAERGLMKKGFNCEQELWTTKHKTGGEHFKMHIESGKWANSGYFNGMISLIKEIKAEVLPGSKEMGGFRWQRTKL